MNGEITGDSDVPEDDLVEDELAEDDLLKDDSDDDEVSDTEIMASLNDDNVGDLSVELNVEELVANLEAADDTVLEQKREIRRKIEEQRAQKEKELDSTYNINLDDDL